MNKAKTRKILLLPDDGIGPEVVREVKKTLEWFNKNKSLDFSFEEELIGGASIDANKIPITDEVFYKSLESGEITHESIPPFPLKFSHQAFCNSCNQTHSMHHSILSEQDLIENLNLDKFKFWHIGGINKTIAWIQAMVIGHLVKHFGVEEALKINSWFRDDRISKGYKPTLSPGEKMYEKLSGTDIFTSKKKKTLF